MAAPERARDEPWRRRQGLRGGWLVVRRVVVLSWWSGRLAGPAASWRLRWGGVWGGLPLRRGEFERGIPPLMLPAPQCALVAPGVRSVGWTNNRHRPGQTQAPVRKSAQIRDWNWAHGRRQPRVCTAGSIRMLAALPHGGARGVAAVCRRPGKDPPRQFGERAFPGFPWMPAWLVKCRSVWRHSGLCMPQRPWRCR